MELSLAMRNARERHGPCMGIDLPLGCDIYPRHKNTPYFFVEAPNEASAKDSGKYRHMRVAAMGNFIDYINRTYYATFQEWLASIPNIQESDIRFGFQRWDGRENSVSLAYAISRIQPEQRVEIPVMRALPPLPPDDEELDELAVMLRNQGLGVNDVMVRDFIPAKMWMSMHK
uniref:Uncharacterized protein n=1 Tax=viral metagenome TaxID=1070528 RepID=A0A6C0JL04_9ZZZZ